MNEDVLRGMLGGIFGGSVEDIFWDMLGAGWCVGGMLFGMRAGVLTVMCMRQTTCLRGWGTCVRG